MKPLAAVLLISQIAKGTRHVDYDYVQKLTKLYRQLFLGENIEELIVKYSPREDEAALKMRKEVVVSHTPAWFSSMVTDFGEVFRIRPVAKGFYNKSGKESEGLQNAVDTYFGKQSLDYWQQHIIHDQSFYDPNSFVVTEIGDFNYKSQKAAPYPFIVKSENALYYNYINDILECLGIYVDAEYQSTDGDKTVTKKGKKYTLYLAGYALTLTPVNPKLWQVKDANNPFNFDIADLPETIVEKTVFQDYYFRAGDEALYKLDVYYNGIEYVNAERIGAKRDPLTDNRTCISLIHPATTYMKQAIRAFSECEITYYCHIYPQKFQYVKRCEVGNDLVCKTSNQLIKNCTICGGTGMPVHKTASDVVTIPLPNNPEDYKDMLDLSKIVHYSYPPKEAIEQQEARIKGLEEKAYEKVFNKDVLTKVSITDTATQTLIEKQSKYNAYLPYAQKVADIYKRTVYLIAAWRDEKKDLIIEYILPGDFKLETLNELLNTLKVANDSGLPAPLKSSITDDIAAKMYTDQPEQLKIYLTKQKYNPFRSKTPAEIQSLVANTLVTQSTKILYANFDMIFTKLEVDNENFYDIKPKPQMELVDKAVADLLATITAENNTATQFGE